MSNRGLIGRRLLGAWEACRRKAGPWVYKSVLRVPGATRVLVYSGGSGRSMNSKCSNRVAGACRNSFTLVRLDDYDSLHTTGAVYLINKLDT